MLSITQLNNPVRHFKRITWRAPVHYVADDATRWAAVHYTRMTRPTTRMMSAALPAIIPRPAPSQSARVWNPSVRAEHLPFCLT